MRAAVGTRIADRYVVLGELGAGGMGVVLRARDDRLGRLVAVKLLPADAVGDEAARKRLVREARSAAALDHPHIVHVYDVGEAEDGGAFLVMELVRGKSLGDHLRDGTLDPAQRLRVIVEAARALGYAHAQGFLHRDIKPDNVMVREDGRAVLLDFGLAKAVVDSLGATMEASLVSSKTSFAGTPAYVSPEQARGEELGPATDQFSLAVTAFEVLTGQLPWEGSSPLEVISHILRGTPRRLLAVAPAMPEALEAVLERALAKNAGERFPSIEAFADALVEAWPGGIAAPASVRSVAEAIETTQSAPGSIARDVRETPRARGRALAVGAAVVALGGALVLALHHRPSETKKAPPALTAASVVACPQFHAHVPQDMKTGWLGAAAATLVCDRVQSAMGGSPERTRIPAELLDLPREPKDSFPAEPFEGDALARSVERAKTFDAWIEGSVDLATEFTVTLDLRDKSGAAIEHGSARARTLLDAIRAAMEPLLPRLPVEEAYAAKWLPGTSARGRVDLFDLHVLVLEEDPSGVAEGCDRLDGRSDLGGLAPFAAALCADARHQPVAAAPEDMSSASAALTSIATTRFHASKTDAERATQRALAEKLGELASAETASSGKALLLAGQAESYYAALADNDTAARAALASIQAWPKVADLRGDAWHRLGFVAGPSGETSASHAAWQPWEAYAQVGVGLRLGPRLAGPLIGFERAYVLVRRGYYAIEYGRRLLELRSVEAARGVAVATGSERLNVLVLLASQKPGEALRAAAHALESMPAKPENGGEAARLAVAALDLAELLGKPSDALARSFYARFLVAEPPLLTRGATTYFSAVSVCVRAPPDVAKPCLERVAALFESGYFGGATKSSRDALVGARAYLAGDFAGASRTWRPVATDLLGDGLRTPISVAFERAGDLSVLERADDQAIEEGSTSPEIELAHVRRALRAEKQGDHVTAKRLARGFVDRWDSADDRPAALAQMNAILAR